MLSLAALWELCDRDDRCTGLYSVKRESGPCSDSQLANVLVSYIVCFSRILELLIVSAVVSSVLAREHYHLLVGVSFYRQLRSHLSNFAWKTNDEGEDLFRSK